MIIEEIELISWGRHKHLKASTASSVVGLLGKNGCGKSTVLAAIKYAFTGVLEDNAETYVRNYGSPNGAKNGSVRIKFVKDGKQGEIFRQVGNTPKRSFSWDGGAPIVAAKAVDTLMSEIFSASKDAIGNLVFVKQGDLDKMMFGSPGERADLFMKMMLLDFLPKRSELVKKKIDELSAGITDYSQLRDMVTNDLKEAMNGVLVAESELNKLQDPGPMLSHLRRLESSAAQLSSKKIEYNAMFASISDKEGQVRSSLARINEAFAGAGIPEVKTSQEVSDSLVKLSNASSELLKKKMQLERGRYLKNERNDLFNRTCAKKRDAASDKQALDVLVTSTPEYIKNANINDLSLRQDVLRSRQMALAEIRERTARLDVLKEEQRQLGLRGRPDLCMCDQLEQERRKLIDTLNDKEKLVKLYTAVLTEHGCASKCPLCSSDLSSMSITKEDLHNEKMHIVDIRSKCSDLDRQILAMRSVASNYDNEWEHLSLKIKMIEEELVKYETTIKTIPEVKETSEELKDLISRATSYKMDYDRRNHAYDLSQAAYESLMMDFSKFNNDDERMSKIREYDSMYSVFGKDPVDVYEEKWNSASDRDMRINTLASTHSNLAAVLQKCKEDYTSLDQAVKVLEAEFNRLFSESPVKLQHLDEVRSKTEELTSRQEEYHNKKGMVESLRVGTKRLENQLSEIESKIAQDARRRTLIENLRMLRETLNKNGLPMTVMNHQFKLLAELVQDHLANLGANFSVSPDPDKPISFCFVRTDEEEEYVMPQEKLSGGQKVRLTVAMLLAIQQLIIPEVGFLVLDEPSVHLDDEGVDSLRELFQTIGTKLSSTGSQVIVCDHDQRLKTSFSALLEITS